jgi:hypothetical protein
MYARLIPLILTGCIEIERPTESSTPTSAYSGWERYQFGSKPGATNCDLYWTVSGTPATVVCPDCIFAFDLDFSLDSTRSTDDGTCFQEQANYALTYVLIGGSGEYSVGTWSDGEVSVFAPATLEDATGKFWYATGNIGYTYGSYYYTQYTSGYGLIQ